MFVGPGAERSILTQPRKQSEWIVGLHIETEEQILDRVGHTRLLDIRVVFAESLEREFARDIFGRPHRVRRRRMANVPALQLRESRVARRGRAGRQLSLGACRLVRLKTAEPVREPRVRRDDLVGSGSPDDDEPQALQRA